MAVLTVSIPDKIKEQQVKSFLDNLGLDYSIALNKNNWWEDADIIKELDKRSEDLKSGKDKGITFEQIKKNLLNNLNSTIE